MKTAFCILAHKYSPVLAQSIDLLGSIGDIYLHVDARSDLAAFGSIVERVHLTERGPVFWGTHTITQSMLAVMRATCNREYGYVAIISGDTLPIRPIEQIDAFLLSAAANGTEFVHDAPLHTDRMRRQRVAYRYPLYDRRNRNKGEAMLRSIQTALKLFPRNRLADALPPLHSGSNWIIVSSALRDYIFDFLESNPWYEQAFMHSLCGDEIFFHTIFAQSPFAAHRFAGQTMFTDWTTGPDFPRTLRNCDLERLVAARDDSQNHFLFARKMADDLDLDLYRRLLLGRK